MLFHFVERKWWYFLFSALLIVPGVFFLAIGGLRPGIEFKGGTLLEVDFATRPEDSRVKEFSRARNERRHQASPVVSRGLTTERLQRSFQHRGRLRRRLGPRRGSRTRRSSVRPSRSS